MYGGSFRPVRNEAIVREPGVYVFTSRRRPVGLLLCASSLVIVACFAYLSHELGSVDGFAATAMGSGAAAGLLGAFVLTQRKTLLIDVVSKSASLIQSNVFRTRRTQAKLEADSVQRRAYRIRSPGAYNFVADVIVVQLGENHVVLFAGTSRKDGDKFAAGLAELGISVKAVNGLTNAWFWSW